MAGLGVGGHRYIIYKYKPVPVLGVAGNAIIARMGDSSSEVPSYHASHFSLAQGAAASLAGSLKLCISVSGCEFLCRHVPGPGALQVWKFRCGRLACMCTAGAT